MKIRSSKLRKATLTKESPEPSASESSQSQDKRYYDHSDDQVVPMRRAREAVQREMESFGDPSEYDVIIVHGQKKDDKPEQAENPDIKPQP